MEELIARLTAMEERQRSIESKLDEILSRGNPKEIMSTREVAEYLGVTPGRIRNLVSEGKIPHGKNGHNFFRRSEIDDWRFGKRIRTNEELSKETR